MNYSYSVLTLVSLFIISTVSCTTPPKTDPLRGYTTKYTRDLWSVCYFAHRRANPMVPPTTFIPVCDCVIDSTRRDFHKSDLDNKTESQMIPYFTSTTSKCMQESNLKYDVPKITGDSLPGLRSL